MTTTTSEQKPFKKISEIEYEVQINGRTKLIKVPFEKVSLLFRAFISNGGIIDPTTGQVQTDIISLISSFKEVGDILLTEYDDYGKVIEAGNCGNLGTTEVIALFQLATSQIESFIASLTGLRTQTAEAPVVKENEQSKKKD